MRHNIKHTPNGILARKLAKGIRIKSTATPMLDATYSLLDTSILAARALDIEVGFGLPGGATTYEYPDVDGVLHTFTASDVVNLYLVVRDLVADMQQQCWILKNGGTPNWPHQKATIA